MKYRNDELDAYLSRPYKVRIVPLIFAIILAIITIIFCIKRLAESYGNKAALESHPAHIDAKVSYTCSSFDAKRKCLMREMIYYVDGEEYAISIPSDKATTGYVDNVYYDPDNPADAIYLSNYEIKEARHPISELLSSYIFKELFWPICALLFWALAGDYMTYLLRRAINDANKPIRLKKRNKK